MTSRLRTLQATRYVTPLREGGSLPAIIEADDDGLYVLKFRGAGQGPRVLVAELVAGELARAAGLRLPELAFVEIAADFARTEPDPEIQHLIRASAGINLALDYLPGSVTFDPVVDRVDAREASEIVWFDAYCSNVDRTARNANMLVWHRQLWLIDHGAALYFHHGGADQDRSQDPFPLIRDHILLRLADSIAEVDAEMASRLTPDAIRGVVELIPDEWLEANRQPESPRAQRDEYARHLVRRVESPRSFVMEACRARSELV